jgi:hypothetical protein
MICRPVRLNSYRIELMVASLDSSLFCVLKFRFDVARAM